MEYLVNINTRCHILVDLLPSALCSADGLLHIKATPFSLIQGSRAAYAASYDSATNNYT